MNNNPAVSDVGHLIEKWDLVRNDIEGKDPSVLTSMSTVKAWFRCENHDHSWYAKIYSVSEGSGCGVCAGRQVCPGFNDFKTIFPDKAALWDFDKNTLNPTEVYARTTKDFWFICEQAHPFSIRLVNVDKGQWCPYCSGRKVLEGYNDLKTTHPDLCYEWSDSNSVSPSEVSAGSHKIVDWVCTKNSTHKYSMEVCLRARSSLPVGCPYCSGHRTNPDQSLAAVYPEVAAQWSELNTDSPWDIRPHSNKNRLWSCDVDPSHTYRSQVYSKVLQGTRCSLCWSIRSKQEIELYDWITNEVLADTKVIHSDKTVLRGKHLDIYIPELKIAIEFNGMFWHSDHPKNRAVPVKTKMDMCNEEGIDLYVVWEDDWTYHLEDTQKWLLRILTENRQNIREATVSKTGNIIKLVGHDGAIMEQIVVDSSGAVVYSDVSADGLKILSDWALHNLGINQLQYSADLCRDKGKAYRINGWAEKFKDPDYVYLYKNKVIVRDSQEGVELSNVYNENDPNRKIYKIWDAGRTVFTLRRGI